MRPRRRDGADRLLGAATTGLVGRRRDWAEAMRAELASIDDPRARRRFARSAATAALGQGLGVHIGLALTASALVAAVALTASRLQLADGSPGVLPVTVPVPALLMVLVAGASAFLARSFGAGLLTGLLSLVVGFGALCAVLAVEGMVWMNRHGVFILDGDPPNGRADATDVSLDIFTTGMWVGHVTLWITGVVLGAVLGVAASRVRSDHHIVAEPMD